MDPLSVKELTKAATGATLYFSQAFNASIINKDNIKNTHIQLFPNPSNNVLYINSDKNIYFTLTNLIGEKIIDSIYVRKGQQTINIKSISSGSYFYMFTNEDNKFEGSGKLLIK